MKRLALLIGTGLLVLPATAYAQSAIPGALDRAFQNIGGGQGSGLSMSLQLLLIMGLLTILPGLLLMMTSFTRILVVLSILRHALGLQNRPHAREDRPERLHPASRERRRSVREASRE